MIAPLPVVPQIHRNLDFADGILEVVRSETGLRNFPLRSEAVFDHELDYWGTMAEGVGKKGELPMLDRYAPPNIWDYNQCMEVRVCVCCVCLVLFCPQV